MVAGVSLSIVLTLSPSSSLAIVNQYLYIWYICVLCHLLPQLSVPKGTILLFCPVLPQGGALRGDSLHHLARRGEEEKLMDREKLR